jgi:hypothetical protein
LPLLGGPRRPQKSARVNIIPQVRDEVKWSQPLHRTSDETASVGGLIAENPQGLIAKFLRVAFAVLGKLNDEFGDRHRYGVLTID